LSRGVIEWWRKRVEDGRTIYEEEVRASILLTSGGEIADDAVNVGGSRHDHVHRVEALL
jgi:hypothetical protein